MRHSPITLDAMRPRRIIYTGAMGRWEPDARGRLLNAAVDLFAAQGYDATTAAQIAAHAGLTKATLFRHFADKREILFQGQDELVALAADGVAAAPSDSDPFELLRSAVLLLCTAHPAERRGTARRVTAILETSAELRERAAAKRATITSTLHAGLTQRLGDARRAGILADGGIRAYYEGFDSWVDARGEQSLADVVDVELVAFRTGLADLAAVPFGTAAAR